MEPKKIVIGDFEFTLIDLSHGQKVCDCHACQSRKAVTGVVDRLNDMNAGGLLLMAEEIGAFVTHVRRVMDAANRHRIPWLRAAFVGSVPLLPATITGWERLAFICDYLGQRGLRFADNDGEVREELAAAMAAKFGN